MGHSFGGGRCVTSCSQEYFPAAFKNVTYSEMNNGDSGPSTNSKARVPPTPANLRFQRRTSERAFYETSLRDGNMEYPGAGTSPWASSPEASRATFGGDVPGHDLPDPAVQHNEGEASGTGPAQNGNRQHEASYPYQEQGGRWSPEQQHQWQQQQQQYQQEQPQEQQRPPGEEPRRPQSARYHAVPPQQRQHMPQYRLQAKITGLERSGKKDPILKFDVYVSLVLPNWPHAQFLTLGRQTYPSSEQLNSVISAERTQNSKS